MTDVRIKFSKHGPIRFLGHLDVMRYFQRSVRRAGIDVRYSEGYSPHQIMSFAQPLSVGATSDGEYLDLSLNREMDPGELCSCLNEVMHEGIVILACEILPERSDKSMTLVAAAEYLLRFRPGHEPLAAEALKTSMEKYLSGDRLPAIKRTKKGEKEIDMKPMVLQWSLEDPQVPMLRCLLRAGSTDNLKPTLLMAGIAANAGIEEGPPVPAREPEGLNADVIVHRVDTYMESNGSYVPMINCT